MGNNRLGETLMILIGSFILATTLYHFHFQNNLAEGGFIGIALLVKNALNISPSITTLVLDVPIIVIAGFFLGKKLLIKSSIGAISFSAFYAFIEKTSHITLHFGNHLWIPAILGGIFAGIGLGLILRSGGATGGDDILTIIMSRKSKISIGKVYFIFDAVILLCSLSYLSWNEVGYTILSVAICAKVTELIYQSKFKTESVSIKSNGKRLHA
ncbi:YitT family protein [Gottfriedia luciferensis]|uniref:YitT family protein n=1 Tax=Gottfriedia luciferensis TaxID=178774 RepID=UPI001F423D7D|nr:YitT family protein [Gottfriedia luciferensis]